MKKPLTAFILALSCSNSFASNAEALENYAAIGAAPVACGFKINQQMVDISIPALFSNPADIAPDGKYWPELMNDLQRIKNITATESGRKAFCNRVSKDLSAFFN